MTDLTTFARRLMRINEKTTQSNTPTAIFGTIGELPQTISARPYYRIGLWPCMSVEKPELAMGMWVLLAHLLERWLDIQVYRLFVKLESELDKFKWTMEQSQFEVDDWPIDPLDENIAIWGKLNEKDGKWELATSIENDLLTGQDNEHSNLVFTADTVIGLLAQLPTIAEKIAANIGAERVDETEPLFEVKDLPAESTLTPLFLQLLRWDVQLLTSLWGVELDDEHIENEFATLLDTAKSVKHDVAAWAVSKAISHTMLPGYSVIGDLFVGRVDEISEAFPESHLPMPLLAPVVFRMGSVQEAYELLEAEVETHPNSLAAWLKLADLYAIGGRIQEAIECFQSAIENEITSSHLYRVYGNVLLAADQYGEIIEEFVLIGPDEIGEDTIIWEAIEAYEAALKANPSDTRALYTQMLQLLYVDAEEERIWAGFKKLLQLDNTGEYVRDVIESMYEIEDIKPGIEAIEAMVKEHGDRVDLYINLACLHLSQDEGDKARTHLEKVRSMTEAVDTLADIEQLLLVAEDPDFEQHFSELGASISAGNSPSAEDVEFLENAVENAAHLITVHLLLAQAYYLWDDNDAALEVLLDTQDKLPDNPSVLDMLAHILWESDEKKLAFQYLNKGLITYPFHVPLLVRTGRYLFDNGQLAEARAYLARAEEIAPRDPTLQGVRTYIARKMAENPDLYEEK